MALLTGVEVRRGGGRESFHAAEVAAVQWTAAGPHLLAWAGEPQEPCWLRSAWKPFQAAAAWECGLAHFGIAAGSPELAIMCASHSATDAQRGAVLRLLAAAGNRVDQLQNGPHEPFSAEGRQMLRATAGAQARLYGNCSGKHAGMLAACRARGWDLASYLQVDHPLTAHVRRRLADFLACPLEQVEVGIDGCRLPTYAAPLAACAAAFARLAPGGDNLTPPALAAAAESMLAHPGLLGDPQGWYVQLARRRPGVLGKSGAEGVHGISLPERRLGVVVKIRDGAHRAVAPLMLAVLHQLDVIRQADLDALAAYARPPVHDLGGTLVGELRAVVELQRGDPAWS
ncbi:MAG: asparaginase [Fimbriimonadaceae bacterium]|nr:asparaginase [Fimbriimonadaceae bacterium]